MHPTALALEHFLAYTMHELTAYRSGVVLDLWRPWDDADAFREIAHVLVDVAQRTALTAVGFHGNTQRGDLGRRAKAQADMIIQAQREKPVLIFDSPIATFMGRNDSLNTPRLIIIDDLSHPERDTDRTHGYAHLYDLHSIVQRRPMPTANLRITGPWLKFFKRRPWDSTVLPDLMRKL